MSTTRDTTIPVLDFDQLARDYMDNLNNTLRNFSPGPDFLQTWAHDDDATRSLVSLVDAARDGGLPGIQVALAADTFAQVRIDELRSELKGMGPVEYEERADKTVLLTVRFAPKGLRLSVHPSYQRAIEFRANGLKRAGELTVGGPRAATDRNFEVTEHGVRLQVRVSEDGIVREARALATPVTALAVVLDAVCVALEGRSLQEGADHAVIRVEAELRDPGLKPPVPGVLTPENADPVFRAAQLVVRALFKEYVDSTRAKVGRNFWDDTAGKDWKALSDEARLERAQSTLQDESRARGLQTIGVDVIEIKDEVRLVIRHTQDPTKPIFGHGMIALERALKKRLDPRIELQLESRADRNKRIEKTDRSDRLVGMTGIAPTAEAMAAAAAEKAAAGTLLKH